MTQATATRTPRKRTQVGGIAGAKPVPPPPVAGPPVATGAIALNKPIASRQRFNQLLEEYRRDYEILLAGQLPTDMFIRCCLNAWVHTKEIAACSGKSILHSTAIAAGMGLLVNGLGGDGWLAAFNSRYDANPECTFLPGYQGLIRCAYKHPSVVVLKAECVRDGDHFLWDCGSNAFIEHNWQMGGGREHRPIVGAWATGEMKGSQVPIVVVQERELIDSFRNTANDHLSVMWTINPAAGYRKSPLKSLCKLLPKSPSLALAMTLEDRYEAGEGISDLSPIRQEPAAADDRAKALAHDLARK